MACIGRPTDVRPMPYGYVPCAAVDRSPGAGKERTMSAPQVNRKARGRIAANDNETIVVAAKTIDDTMSADDARHRGAPHRRERQRDRRQPPAHRPGGRHDRSRALGGSRTTARRSPRLPTRPAARRAQPCRGPRPRAQASTPGPNFRRPCVHRFQPIASPNLPTPRSTPRTAAIWICARSWPPRPSTSRRRFPKAPNATERWRGRSARSEPLNAPAGATRRQRRRSNARLPSPRPVSATNRSRSPSS